MEVGIYEAVPEKNGNGTFLYSDCGHKMYSIRGEMSYHGCLCPGCLWKGIHRMLYIRGSEEANEYMKEKMKGME